MVRFALLAHYWISGRVAAGVFCILGGDDG